MPKKPVSLTLEEANIAWLKGVTARSGGRSVSDTVDRLITSARESGVGAPARSVVGSIDLPAHDTTLVAADVAVRDLFAESLSRPFLVNETRAALTPKRRRG